MQLSHQTLLAIIATLALAAPAPQEDQVDRDNLDPRASAAHASNFKEGGLQGTGGGSWGQTIEVTTVGTLLDGKYKGEFNGKKYCDILKDFEKDHLPGAGAKFECKDDGTTASVTINDTPGVEGDSEEAQKKVQEGFNSWRSKIDDVLFNSKDGEYQLKIRGVSKGNTDCLELNGDMLRWKEKDLNDHCKNEEKNLIVPGHHYWTNPDVYYEKMQDAQPTPAGPEATTPAAPAPTTTSG